MLLKQVINVIQLVKASRWLAEGDLKMRQEKGLPRKKKLTAFILQCQDPEHGGIADRPGDMVDVFHTVFGLAGLSLLRYPGLLEVDPA